MKRLDARLQKVQGIVPGDCIGCPDFTDALMHLDKYGLRTPQELGASVLRICHGRPTEIATAHPDGTPFEYFEIDEARACSFGKAKRLHDAATNLSAYCPEFTYANAVKILSY